MRPTAREEIAERGELNEFHRKRLDFLSEFGAKDRSPVERIVIDLTNAQTVKIGPGFWLYLKKGCGHDVVDVTFNVSRDATNNKYRFPLSVGECFPWPFKEAVIEVPSGLSAGSTMTFEVARYPVPIRNTSDVQQLHNRTSFMTGQKNVAAAATAERLVATSTPIPDGYAVVIKAKHTNTGLIEIGNTQANAQDGTVAFRLEARDSIKLAIDDLFKIWLDATVNGEGVEFFVEAI